MSKFITNIATNEKIAIVKNELNNIFDSKLNHEQMYEQIKTTDEYKNNLNLIKRLNKSDCEQKENETFASGNSVMSTDELLLTMGEIADNSEVII